MLHLGMDNGPEIANVHDLVQGDLLGLLILNVAHPAIAEGVPLDLEFAKHTLDGSKDRQ